MLDNMREIDVDQGRNQTKDLGDYPTVNVQSTILVPLLLGVKYGSVTVLRSYSSQRLAGTERWLVILVSSKSGKINGM